MQVVPIRARRVIIGHLDFEVELLARVYSKQHVVAVSGRGHVQAVGVEVDDVLGGFLRVVRVCVRLYVIDQRYV